MCDKITFQFIKTTFLIAGNIEFIYYNDIVVLFKVNIAYTKSLSKCSIIWKIIKSFMREHLFHQLQLNTKYIYFRFTHSKVLLQHQQNLAARALYARTI